MEHDRDVEARRPGRGEPPGGRATRGPAVHSGGEQEPQGLVPPYEGRKKRADTVDTPRPPEAGEEDLGGAAGMRQWDGELAGPPVETLPDKGTAAPGQAEEQPASDYADQKSGYKGVGPAHMWGTNRGEDRAKGKSEEEVEEGRLHPGVKPSRPIDR